MSVNFSGKNNKFQINTKKNILLWARILLYSVNWKCKQRNSNKKNDCYMHTPPTPFYSQLLQFYSLSLLRSFSLSHFVPWKCPSYSIFSLHLPFSGFSQIQCCSKKGKKIRSIMSYAIFDWGFSFFFSDVEKHPTTISEGKEI